jgi:hypothetical protein
MGQKPYLLVVMTPGSVCSYLHYRVAFTFPGQIFHVRIRAWGSLACYMD